MAGHWTRERADTVTSKMGLEKQLASSKRPAAEQKVTEGSGVLLATKLQSPVRRRELVSRDRLIEELSAESPKLTLVDAPAGWGKTTLLVDWQSAIEETRLFAWVSLDRGDNDRVRFWTYLVEAVRGVDPAIGKTSLTLLRTPGVNLVEVVLLQLINELEDISGEVVLVLDDYHLITNREIHEAMAFLIDHMPPTLRLVLATRSDPPLPIARLRARGELIEVRAEQLCFTAEEAEELLTHALGLSLDPSDVARLRTRTEGWGAGLYLAALSLRGRSDVSGFIEAFAGDDRHIVDYLGAEVLEGLSDDIRSFLLRTSVLDRLCGPLCDAVIDAEGSAGMLEEIERCNLFLVALDSKRFWYRYHHLFGELLRHELARTQPDLAATLHRRAANWYRADGLVPEAIHHYISAGEIREASELIALNWNEFVNQGQLETVDGWLDALPEWALTADPRLCLARAGTSLTQGKRGEVDRWLDAAEQSSYRPTARPGGTSVESEAAIYRAVHRYMLGDVASATEAAQRAVDFEREGSSPWAAMAFAALGRSLYWRGNMAGATTALEEAVRRAQPPRNNLSVIGALGYLAAVHADRGDAETAEELADTAIKMSDEYGLAEHWVTVMALVARGTVLATSGRLHDAERAISRAEEVARRGAGAVETACSKIKLAQVRLALGDREAAASLLREAHVALDNCPDPGILEEEIARADRKFRRPPRAVGHGEELSDREQAVLRLLAGPLSQREIGAALHVSQNTVKTHARGIYRKLSVSSRAEAVARARELGFL